MNATDFERATALDSAPVRPARPQPLRARPFGVRAALGIGVCANAILVAALIFGRPHHDADRQVAADVDAAAAPAAKPAIGKITVKADSAEMSPLPIANAKLPFSAFDLKSPEFEQEKKTISVRDGDDGVGRIDSVTLGQFAAGAPFMRVDVHQSVTEKETGADFFLDMTRHATQVSLNVAKINPPTALMTRFGAFQAADIRLTQPAAEGVAANERNCLAARLVEPKTSLIIAGLACGGGAQPLDRVAFGCMLDRLQYAPGSDNNALGEFFAKGEAVESRNCNVSRDDMTATVAKKAAAPAKPRKRRR